MVKTDGQGRLPSWSNCKGPTRAAVCSHSWSDVPTRIPLTVARLALRHYRQETVGRDICRCIHGELSGLSTAEVVLKAVGR
jgi:hypothetical protein